MRERKFQLTSFMKFFFFLLASLSLVGCSSFSGIRTPKFDGEPFEMHEDKIAAYQEAQEIVGEEKDYYIPEPFSADILEPSLTYVEHEPVLLEEGTYVIGEDLPAGRVNIYGEAYDSNLTMMSDPHIRVPGVPNFSGGTLFVRDPSGNLYFENMFHPIYGTMQAQVDFIEGHTIDITGVEPAFFVFYETEIPEDPYIFDPRLNAIEEEETSEEEFGEIPVFFQPERMQPIEVFENGEVIEMQSGIYEVGVHFEPGTYQISETNAPHHTEFFLFREGEEERVFEITDFWSDEMRPQNLEETESIIELQVGDKIYPSYMNFLQLIRMSE